MSIDPAIARHRLGIKLRELREARSLRLEDVAASLDIAPSTLSRIETGKAATRRGYLAGMLTMYSVDDPSLRETLEDLARDGGGKAWWAAYADLLPDDAGRYLGLEAAASLIRCYSVLAVPDLLQTRDYAVAACRATQPGLTADQVRTLVTATMRRQDLVRASLARVHVVIDEAALLRRIAPADVIAAQLNHLRAAAARPTVIVQITRLSAPPPVLSPPFTVLTLTDPADADMKAGYGPSGQVIISTRAADTHAAVATFTTLAQAALPPDASVSRIGGIADRLTMAGRGSGSRAVRTR